MLALTQPAHWLAALNLAFIALLPRVFFRRGTLNARWWLTAAPFMLAGAGLLLGGFAPASDLSGDVPAASDVLVLTQLAGITCTAASIALMAYTLGSHQQRVSLWHQENDTPTALVTRGAYARIRHPFYAAFLLALLACVLVAPSWWTVLALLCAMVQLRRTAQREEARLLMAFGEAYMSYMRRTGRFLPKLRHHELSVPK